jgi:hypothetical protein
MNEKASSARCMGIETFPMMWGIPMDQIIALTLTSEPFCQYLKADV